MRFGLAIASTFIVLVLLGCESTVVQNQRDLQRHFGLSPETPLLESDGYPAAVGFGQREGLQIEAVYQLSPPQVAAIVKRLGCAGPTGTRLSFPDGASCFLTKLWLTRENGSETPVFGKARSRQDCRQTPAVRFGDRPSPLPKPARF